MRRTKLMKTSNMTIFGEIAKVCVRDMSRLVKNGGAFVFLRVALTMIMKV